MIYTVLTGEKLRLFLQLREMQDGITSNYQIPTGSTVKVVLRHGENAISTVCTCSEIEDGASWSTGLVVAVFNRSETLNWDVHERVSIEVFVDDGTNVDKWLSQSVLATVLGLI